jgi:hypothetical protein
MMEKGIQSRKNLMNLRHAPYRGPNSLLIRILDGSNRQGVQPPENEDNTRNRLLLWRTILQLVSPVWSEWLTRSWCRSIRIFPDRSYSRSWSKFEGLNIFDDASNLALRTWQCGSNSAIFRKSDENPHKNLISDSNRSGDTISFKTWDLQNRASYVLSRTASKDRAGSQTWERSIRSNISHL